MRWGLAIVMAGCVRHGVDVSVVDVRQPKELAAIEPLGVDPTPALPEDFFVEIDLAATDLYAGAILADRSVRLRIPGAEGCIGTLAQEDVERVLGLVDRIRFFSMAGAYPGVGAYPGYKITVSARGRRHSVFHVTSERSAVMRGAFKGLTDVGDRLALAELEGMLEHILGFEKITYVRSIDLERRPLDAVRVQNGVDDALQIIRARCGALQATALQVRIRSNGAVYDTAPVPGGALDACADEVLRSLVFEPACSGTIALLTLDSEGLHGTVHHLAPDE